MVFSKRKLTGVIAGTLAITAIAGSFAYYTSTNSIDNRFKTNQYGDVLYETFTPPEDGWNPGQEVTKEVGVKNTGGGNIVVRVKMDETWWEDKNGNGTMDQGEQKITFASNQTAFHSVTKNGTVYTATQGSTTDGLLTNDQSVVYKSLAASGWTFNSADGYWYYNTQLTPNASTGNLLTSVALASNVDNGKYDTTKYYYEGKTEPITEPTGQSGDVWRVYTGAVPTPNDKTNSIFTRVVSKLDTGAMGYANAIYDLVITKETCQANADAVAATWSNVPTSVINSWKL